MELDLHIHSRHSQDSRTSPERIVERAVEVGLGAIAVTDHNSWEGARAAARLAKGRIMVIPGAEIKTTKGDLLALFVDEVASREWASAVEEIRSKGGMSIVPHPADSKRLTREDIAIADGIEVFNSTCGSDSNLKALALAKDLKKPGIGSSDAHIAIEIGNGRTMVEDCTSLEELREKLMTNPLVSRSELSNRFTHFLNASFCFAVKGAWKR